MTSIRITLNGQSRLITAPPDTPLIWVLRDHLRLTATRFGCGMGTCGVCTVLKDGRAVRSCQLSIARAEGAHITTVEGLAREHACLRRACREEDLALCNYCESGMLLAAAALLRDQPKPGQQDIDRALEGVICRCGSYPRIRRVVQAAAGARERP